MKVFLIWFILLGKPIAPDIETRIEELGGGSYRISWITDSYASTEQYRLLYRKSPVCKTLRGCVQFVFLNYFLFLFVQNESKPMHSYAWTSVVIPGPQHTVQESYKNKASFILTQLEEEVEYQVQVQAKNAFGWGKVSEQINFQTSTAGRKFLHFP